jgi:hypothetical protein
MPKKGLEDLFEDWSDFPQITPIPYGYDVKQIFYFGMAGEAGGDCYCGRARAQAILRYY